MKVYLMPIVAVSYTEGMKLVASGSSLDLSLGYYKLVLGHDVETKITYWFVEG